MKLHFAEPLVKRYCILGVMNNTKAFGSVLSAIRNEQGFPSAHQCFKGIGGSKAWGFHL